MIEWQKLVKWQDDWLNIHPEAIEKRKAFLRDVLYEDYDAFMNAFIRVLNSRTMLIRSMVDVFADQLELDSSVNIASKLERLLEIAADLDEKQEPDPQRWFEALARFDQVIAVAKIEREHSRESLSRDMTKLLVFLRHNWFLKEDLSRVEVNCYHDPANEFRVSPENVGVNEMLDRPDLEHRRSVLPCRRVGGIGYVYLRDRIKDSFDTWLKIQRQLKDLKCKNPFVVQDLCGITLLFPTEADLQNGAVSLISLLEAHGGKILDTTHLNQNGDQCMDSSNKHSSPEYKAAKILVSFLGGIFEIQLQTFHDYYTSKRSPTESNHDLYRLKQNLDIFLPILWPLIIYDVDWSNPVVRKAAWQAKVDQLGWRVKGNLQ